MSMKRPSHRSNSCLPVAPGANEPSPGKANRTSSAYIATVGPVSPARIAFMLRAIIFPASHESIGPPPLVVTGRLARGLPLSRAGDDDPAGDGGEPPRRRRGP